MIILSLDELKVIAKKRDIKDYENKSEDDLIKILSEPRTKLKLSKKRIKDIREDFNELKHMFSGLRIKQIRKNLYDIKNPRILSRSKINEIEKDLIELEENLSKLNKYYNYDNIEYRRIRDIENLFGEFDDDYYKPIKTRNSAFNANYIEYESRGDKGKILDHI